MFSNTKTSRGAALAFASLIAVASLGASPALATDSDKNAQQNQLQVDRVTTGSISAADKISNCNPAAPNAGMICRITGGNPDARFPSAPSTSFGF